MTQEDQALVRFDDPELARTEQLARTMVASGFFRDTRTASQAIVKIIAGRDVGVGPIAAMTGIHIIEGKIELGAHIMATLVKRSPRYNYRVLEHSDEVCEIAFYERLEAHGPEASISGGWTEVGRSRFTLDDARRAKIYRAGGNWEKWPRAMLFARALSSGVRTHCPDVTAGNTIYVEGEVGEEPSGEALEPVEAVLDAEVVAEVEAAPEVVEAPAKLRLHRDEPADAGEALARFEAQMTPADTDDAEVVAMPAGALEPASPEQVAEIMAERQRTGRTREQCLAVVGIVPAEGQKVHLNSQQADRILEWLAGGGDA